MFTLSNNQRKCFSITPINEQWESIEAKPSPYDNFKTYLYLDGNTIVKCILSGDEIYSEYELSEKITPDKKYLLPKTDRGKPVLLSSSSIQKRTGIGMCLQYYQDSINLYNQKTECSYYHNTYENDNINSITDFSHWIENWCKDTTNDDIEDIISFSKSSRQHIKFKEGDVFRFKINRRLYGYGRVLLDYDKMRKEKIPFWDILMCKPVVCSVYHIATERSDLSVNELKSVLSLPSTIIADNNLYYGEYSIIGNIPVNINTDEDYPIMYGRGIGITEKPAIFYQCGKVFRKIENGTLLYGGFINNGVNFSLNFKLDILKQCMSENSNDPYWSLYYTHSVNTDLRNPQYKEKLQNVKKQFDL